MLATHLLFRKPFYGWIVVAVAALVAFSSGPGQSYTFSVFIDSMMLDSGLSRTDLSTLYAVGTGLSAGVVMVVSRLADKFGPKLMIVLTASALTLACVAMAFAAGGLSFFVAFAALRAFGQGSIPINATLLTAQWFDRMRGRAMAVMGLGFAASMAIMPILSKTLIDNMGWREAYIILGVFIWILVVPAAILLLQNTPEEIGLHPDGSRDPPESEMDTLPNDQPDRRKVLSSATFWALALPLSTSPFVSTALVFHQAAIFLERDLSVTMAAGIFLPLSLSAVISSMAAGIIADRIGPKNLFHLAMVALLASMAVLTATQSWPMALCYSIILGASNGIGRIVTGVIWAHLYGRHRLGRIQGSATMVMIAASALGPLPLAISHSITGGFATGILLMTTLPVASTIAMASINPQKGSLQLTEH